MILFAIGVYVAFALVNYRIAVLLLAPLSLFLHMFPVVDRQMFSILDCCCLVLMALFPLKCRFVSKLKTYPFFIPSILVALSFAITNVLAESHWPSTVFVLSTIYGFPFLVWSVIDDERDLKFLLYSYAVCFAFCVLYALVELFFSENVVVVKLLEMGIVNPNVLNYAETRFGFKRLQSFFDTPMSMGLAVGTFGYLLFEYRKITKDGDLLIYFLMGGCFVLPWLTGSRAVFVAMIILVIPVLYDFMRENSSVLLKIALLGGAVFLLGDWILTLVDSFVNSDSAVSGSSLDMRLMQLAVILPFFFNSPIWGNGYAYTWTFVKAVDSDLLGAESVWLQIPVDFGIVGMIAYVACILYMAKKLSKCLGKRGAAMPLAVISAYSLSTFLGLELNYFFILCIIIIKLYEYNKMRGDEEVRPRENIEENQ